MHCLLGGKQILPKYDLHNPDQRAPIRGYRAMRIFQMQYFYRSDFNKQLAFVLTLFIVSCHCVYVEM